jgi:hypothetical protein
MTKHRNEKGELHRTDGPAVVLADGYQAWYFNGKRHRIGGPAVVYTDGSRDWWVNGERVMEPTETINLFDEYNKLKTENERLREENNDLKSALMNVLFSEVSHVEITEFTKEKE